MGNISNISGSNIGGIAHLYWVFQSDCQNIQFSLATLIATVNLKTGCSWNEIYGSNGTISSESAPKDSDPGILYSYTLKIQIPKNRQDVEAILASMNQRKLIIKIEDKNGTVRLYGSMEEFMIMTYQSLTPADVPGFNGYELTFQGDLIHPALFIPTENGISGNIVPST
jgi:hypothetical protein